MGRTRRRLLVLSGVVVVAAGGFAAWLVLRPAEASTEPVIATATVGPQRQTVAASGTVEPAEQADLNFTVSGTVTEVLVKEGDQVTAGQALASVDNTLLVAQRDAAQADLDAAEEKADSNDDAAAQAAVVSARSALTAAQNAVDSASLTSTIAGTVASVGVKVGDRVGDNAAASGNSNDTAQFTIVSTKTFVVDAKVGGQDVDKIRAGMAVEIRATGAAEAVDGTVQTVGLVASADESGAATFPVTVAVTGERDDIYAGSSADVAIVTAERQDVLTVPTLALHTSGGTTYVNKVVGGTTTRTDVRTGETFGAQTEITSGLRKGDQVEVAVVVPNGGGNNNGRDGGVFPGGGGQVFVPGGGGGNGGGRIGNGGFGGNGGGK